jgi:probable rRNA maturation factor
LSIRLYHDDIGCRYQGWRLLKKTLENIICSSGKKTGEIDIIITSDEKLIAINREFLEHDYYTDVITFNYNSGKLLNGEIYISIDTVRFNAHDYKVSLKDEMARVIIHGVLHLAGYDDKTESGRSLMRAKEEFWVKCFNDM